MSFSNFFIFPRGGPFALAAAGDDATRKRAEELLDGTVVEPDDVLEEVSVKEAKPIPHKEMKRVSDVKVYAKLVNMVSVKRVPKKEASISEREIPEEKKDILKKEAVPALVAKPGSKRLRSSKSCGSSSSVSGGSSSVSGGSGSRLLDTAGEDPEARKKRKKARKAELARVARKKKKKQLEQLEKEVISLEADLQKEQRLNEKIRQCTHTIDRPGAIRSYLRSRDIRARPRTVQPLNDTLYSELAREIALCPPVRFLVWTLAQDGQCLEQNSIWKTLMYQKLRLDEQQIEKLLSLKPTCVEMRKIEATLKSLRKSCQRNRTNNPADVSKFNVSSGLAMLESRCLRKVRQILLPYQFLRFCVWAHQNHLYIDLMGQ